MVKYMGLPHSSKEFQYEIDLLGNLHLQLQWKRKHGRFTNKPFKKKKKKNLNGKYVSQVTLHMCAILSKKNMKLLLYEL